MKTKLTNRLFAAALAALVWGIAFVPVNAAESGKKAQVTPPEAVMTAFHKAYPKATVRDISQETKDGTTYYEIESIDGKHRRDLLYLADGAVYEIEESVSIADLPKVITSAISAKFPQGELRKAERITHGTVIEYEVLLEDDENNIELLLDSGGKITSQASVKDDDDENDTDEETDED